MRIPLLLAFVAILSCRILGQSNDASRITEARLALEKYNDCRNAISALNEVSEAGKRDPLFHLYAGKAFDCTKDFEKAIHHYEAYLDAFPATQEILQRAAELRYLNRVKENRFDLAGKWYADGEPEKIRVIEQDGESIRLYDPIKQDTKFKGVLQESGAFKGGRTYFFDGDHEDPYYGTARPTYYEPSSVTTDEDILTISEDGNTITIERRTPVLGYERDYHWVLKGYRGYIESWASETFIYHRVR